MAATELGLLTRSGSEDGAKEHRVRTFYVDTAPDSALLDPQLPSRGSVYPGGNTNVPFPLILDSYKVRPAENGLSYVDCIYTNDRSGRLSPHPDKTRPGFQGWSIDFAPTTADIPTITTFPLKIPGAAELEETTPGVKVSIFKVAQCAGIYEVTVPLQTLTSRDLAAIKTQQDHIHNIAGVPFRFHCGKVVQTERDAWEATYTWHGDDGTPLPSGMPLVQDQNGGEDSPWYRVIGDDADHRRQYWPPALPNKMHELDHAIIDDGRLFIRSPFHVITYALDTNLIPSYAQFCPYSYAADGWRRLPGGLQL